jgi:uncharacterized Zn-binding protein involved in type VI secretion
MYSLHTQQQKSPAGTNKGNDRKIFSSPSGSTIILDDKKGGERVEVYMKQGKMRLVLDPHTGIEITNELGDIEIRCNKLSIEGEDTGEFKFKKGLTIEADGIELKADKGVGIKTSGKVSVKGKIDLKANGVLAGGKQIAKMNDQVVGIDKHDIMVPSPSGLVKVPMIPHPFVGKLADKLSQDVKIGGQAAATKGSKAKINPPMHLPMPPGVQFAKAPKGEGEVSSGTIANVKINGKEAAVLGSKVKTCSDPMPMENCQIIAMGVAPKLPIQIPVTNPIDRSLSNPKWSLEKSKIGEMLKLTVQLKKQYENAGVEFKIFPEGANVQKDQPIVKVYGRNVGGKADAEWEYKFIKDPAKPLKKKPKFIFTADSFGCIRVQSGPVEISTDYKVIVTDTIGNIISNTDCDVVTADKVKQSVKTDGKGMLTVKDVVPGDFEIIPHIKDDEGNAKKMYARYTVNEGDTLANIVDDFIKGELIKVENKIVADESISEDSVWNDEKNKGVMAICNELYKNREGKNPSDKRIYAGEMVYLPCKSLIIVV